MKVGDLVKVKECYTQSGWESYGECQCFFCASGSNRIGVVTGPAPRDQWHVMFDTGMWRLDNHDEEIGDVTVITSDEAR